MINTKGQRTKAEFTPVCKLHPLSDEDVERVQDILNKRAAVAEPMKNADRHRVQRELIQDDILFLVELLEAAYE